MPRLLALLLLLLAAPLGAVVSSPSNQVIYTGTGTQATYAVPWFFFQAADLAVTENTGGVITTLALTSGYTVTGAANPNGGSITLTAGNLASGTLLTIARSPSLVQLTSLRSQGAYNPWSVENALDLATMQIQATQAQAARSLQFPIGDTAATSVLPSATARANQFLAFDASGNAILSGGGASIPQGSINQAVATMASLKGFANPANGYLVSVSGYHAAGDGGGGIFWWNAADSRTDDGGTIVQLAGGGTGRWNRVYDTGALDVRWFGATGNGSTDDTTAVSGCITAAASAVVPAYIPPGTFLVQPLTISSAGAILNMDRLATLLSKTGSTSSIITVSATGVRITGGVLNGTSQASGDGITINADDCTVLRTKSINSPGRGICAQGANKVRVQDCEVISSGSIGIFAVATTANLTEAVIINNRVDRSALSPSTITEGGLKVHGVPSTYTISEVEVSGNTVLLPVSPTDQSCIGIEVWGGINQATVSHNRTSGGYMGISCDHTFYSSVVGNSIYNSSGIGIEIPSGTYVTVSGNSVNGNGLTSEGITVDGAVDPAVFITITANTILGCANYAIHVSPGVSASNIVISSNSIFHAGAYAIYLAKTTGFAITGNIVIGSGSGALKAISLDTTTQGTITGNLLSTWVQNGIIIYTASTTFTCDYLIIAGNAFINCNVQVGNQLAAGSVIGTNCSWQVNSWGFGTSYGIRTVTSAYTSSPMQDRTIRCSATTGPFSVTLPTGQIPAGYEMILIKVDSTSNAVTLVGTINGVSNPTLTTQYQTMRIRWTSATWEQW